MKKSVLLAALIAAFALTACGKSEDAAMPVEATTAATPAAEPAPVADAAVATEAAPAADAAPVTEAAPVADAPKQ